jgi:hypothetical protein
MMGKWLPHQKLKHLPQTFEFYQQCRPARVVQWPWCNTTQVCLQLFFNGWHGQLSKIGFIFSLPIPISNHRWALGLIWFSLELCLPSTAKIVGKIVLASARLGPASPLAGTGGHKAGRHELEPIQFHAIHVLAGTWRTCILCPLCTWSM